MKALLAITILYFSSAAAVLAGEGVIPVAHEAGRYEAAWKKNPFLRLTSKPQQAREAWSRDWVLGGMAEFEGKIQVNVINTKTGEYLRLRGADSEKSGMRLVRVHFSRSRAESFAEVEKDGETAVLKYSQPTS